MKKFIIGISAHYHDSSVCLFRNGELIFACEEEKFTGIKHDSNFPEKSLSFIYRKFKIKRDDIEAVCYYENPQLKQKRVIDNAKKNFFKSPIYSIKSYLKNRTLAKQINTRLKRISDNIFYSTHHESHLYYSYYTSSFNDALCLSIDGVGELDTMSLGVVHHDGIEYCQLAHYPHSIGLFYSAMTSFLGFKPNEGEYKVMGLASYGNPSKYIDVVRKLITYDRHGLICNMNVFCWDKSDKIMFNKKLPELLNIEPRLPEEDITSVHMDLAASIQLRYEEILFSIIKSLSMINRNTNMCLSGGCAYNGTANGKITTNTHINHLWIPPAPSDAGSAIGACIKYLVTNKLLKGKVNKNPFLGPFYNDNHILKALNGNRYRKFHSIEKLTIKIAEELNKGKIVGWYQGHIEFGARALGNRSILANPTITEMKDKINKVVKKREGFRPFAPMVIKEKQNQFFDMSDDVPYMNQVVNVKKEYRNKLKAVTHVDGTARVQTVYNHTITHNLLLEFEKLSGFPILLNTSFNVKDKTIVLTPKDAVDTFYDTEMDILVLGNYVVYKN